MKEKNAKTSPKNTSKSNKTIKPQPLPKKTKKDLENKPFPIVGIGASAGGLAAFEEFFSAIPTNKDIDMAFILVQHLAPDHKSILTELVRRYTRMKVYEVEDGMIVQSNCAYIIPPNRNMTLSNGKLQLLEMDLPRGQRLPIDFFFRSLALDLHDHAICIVLSGTGSDGTLGIKAIKAEGGMIMVQTPESADFDGMPLNAIATGMADYILSPAEMPAQLMAYAKNAFSTTGPLASTPSSKIENTLSELFLLLKSKTGHDFSLYKRTTILRRIEHQMTIRQIPQLENYINFLQQHPGEVEILFHEFLIGVTHFFRDPDAFLELQKQIIPHLFANKKANTLIRVWVPGCSTGEEAYTIAILLSEQMKKLNKNFQVQIFATDIDSKAIEIARTGIYPASISSDITPEFLAQYFTFNSISNTFQVRRNIREMLVFSEQDLIKDPPFSKLDLISCRNLLIYLSAELQKKLFPLFHYALLTGGLLFLGTSESIGEYSNLFSILNRKYKLFQSKIGMLSPGRAVTTSIIPSYSHHPASFTHTRNSVINVKINLRELTEKTVLQQYAAAAALVNDRGDIFYIHGRTGNYLEPAQGEMSINILSMAREGLKRYLTIALHRAVISMEPVKLPGIEIKNNDSTQIINLIVRPIPTEANQIDTTDTINDKEFMPGESNLFLVIFEEAPEIIQKSMASAIPADTPGHLTNDNDKQILLLKQELLAKDTYLQSIITELETSNEELKSSNEEMQSVNEELQSTNEELETSKEELQSVNEELSTVNTELQSKVAELSRINNDMNNLIAGTGIGTIFVDHQMRILRFTPEVTKMINLIQSDTGRPVSHIVSNLIGYNNLSEDVQEVLDTLIPKEIEVQANNNSWYILRIMPYRTIENVIEGAVITFVDITQRKLSNDIIKSLLAEKEIILQEVHHRIKNNMNTLNSLLALQARTMTNPAVVSALEDAASRVQSMLVLYDKLYQAKNISELPAQEYIPSLVEQILYNFPNYNSIKLEKKIDNFNLSANILSSLGIIINELLTNIMKYAFIGKPQGLIKVTAFLKDNTVTLTIYDNGNGLPKDIDLNNSTGFGLKLVQLLTKQIGGRIRIEREKGTSIILEFELSK